MSSKVLKAAGAVRPPNAGKGRKKGVPNKTTAALKDLILGALADAGGQAYLMQQAQENPTAFLTLVGKVIPLQVKADGEVGVTVRIVDTWSKPRS